MKICCWIALLIIHLTVINNPWAQDSFLVGEHGELIIGKSLYYESAFSPDDQYIAGVSTTGISIWNAETFELIEHVNQEGGFHFLKWHPNVNLLIACNTANGKNVVYNLEQNEIISTFNDLVRFPYFNNVIDHPNILNFSVSNTYITFLGSSSKCNSDDRNRIIHKVYEKQESYEVDG